MLGGLNAPYGARCFLTKNDIAVIAIPYTGLNAPYGAWCFLTIRARRRLGRGEGVLMHLMVLGAFWHIRDDKARAKGYAS